MSNPADDNTDSGSTSLMLHQLTSIAHPARVVNAAGVELDHNDPQFPPKPQAAPQAAPSLADVLALCMQSKQQPEPK